VVSTSPVVGSSSTAVADSAPPVFAGVQTAYYCHAGPVSGQPTSYSLTWQGATDDASPSSEIVYDIFVASMPGGENFSQPTWTTPPGITEYQTPELPGEGAYFVVRARDVAGNEDLNTEEREGINLCE
jgi:hypothetical protein